MKFKLLAPLVGLVLAGSTARPGIAEVPSLTLDEVLIQAMTRPQAVAAEQQAIAAAELARAEKRRASWPAIEIVSGVEQQAQDFRFTTPLGEFTLGDRTSSFANFTLVQPLLDPAHRFHAVPAAAQEAGAARAQAERAQQQLAVEAANRFVSVLEIDARLAATTTYIASLEARLSESQTRVAAGRALEADTLKVQLELDAALLDRTTLVLLRDLTIRDLGLSVGQEGVVEPRFDGQFDRGLVVTPEELIAQAVARRGDLAALAATAEALKQRAAAVRGERWPRLEANANWLLSDGAALRPDELLSAGLRVSWRPLAAGTRKPQAAALLAQATAVLAQHRDLQREIELAVRTAWAKLVRARATVSVRQSGIGLASETLRVERERHASGRATTNDLLVAEAQLRQERTEHALAQFAVLRAWIELGSAVGDLELLRTPNPEETP